MRTVLVGLLTALVAAGCTSGEGAQTTDEAPVLAFEAASIRLFAGRDTTTLLAELAETPQQHALGLMERHHLADTAGMLFLYPTNQAAGDGFWMFRTRIPLDIAFIDSAGVFRSIQHMVPCPTDLAQGCPSYPPGQPYRSALEVNAGYFVRHRLGVGSRLMLEDTVRRVRGAKAR